MHRLSDVADDVGKHSEPAGLSVLAGRGSSGGLMVADGMTSIY